MEAGAVRRLGEGEVMCRHPSETLNHRRDRDALGAILDRERAETASVSFPPVTTDEMCLKTSGIGSLGNVIFRPQLPKLQNRMGKLDLKVNDKQISSMFLFISHQTHRAWTRNQGWA